jgi:hypothetical protein
MARRDNKHERASAVAGIPVVETGSIASYGASASVVVPSAEGVTTYRGADADPTEQTLRWLDAAFAGIQERHNGVNASLVDPEGHP